jgi:inorganic triphosphatase YgiF
MPPEVEAKLQAGDPAPLDALSSETTLGGATLGPARTVDETDRYLDTVDGRLDAARWACRLRTREGAVRVSLKGPTEGPEPGWLHRRPEIEGPATDSSDPADWPPSEARGELERLSGGAPLIERLRLHQQRTERAVHVGGRRVATLSLDRVAIARGAQKAGELFIVELELTDADALAPDALQRMADALAARPGLVPDPRTKLEHALERLAEA